MGHFSNAEGWRPSVPNRGNYEAKDVMKSEPGTFEEGQTIKRVITEWVGGGVAGDRLERQGASKVW